MVIIKILVLAGGKSPERDVSMVSASRIAKALIEEGNSVLVVDLAEGVNSLDDAEFSNDAEQISQYIVPEEAPDIESMPDEFGNNIIECCKSADVVYLALHGSVGENGKLQALLDINNISYTGSGFEGCALAMNKHISKLLAKSVGVKTADWSVNKKNADISYPCVVKPSGCGSSVGVSMVNNDDECETAIKEASVYDDCVLVEEKIEGREFSVGILNGRALPVIEIETKSGFYDYKNKYQPGLTAETCPALLRSDIAIEMQNSALKMHNVLLLGYYSRIDFMVSKSNEIYFLEANALPGMTPASLLPQEARAAGIDYSRLCQQIALNPFNKK
ncbi:MAG: D-alanine--D-alanine ligase [Acetobacter sp.]|nr:D-alanine--D-alanine ligase [Bacteroides sp.]MCM1341050.1 D-alanine--D-alanine ligase [Acetobacter sp.]MCM1432394.1 D-alanine--D-alanine ligase [Clostridiales bacterium]